jgi:hypothetical protein
MHVADGGVASQLASQRAANVASQLASQRVRASLSDAIPTHSASQLAVAIAVHSARQENIAGSTSQLASHADTSQLAMHDADALAVHIPSQPTYRSAAHAARKLIGSHITVHPPWTSTSHIAVGGTNTFSHAASCAWDARGATRMTAAITKSENKPARMKPPVKG